MWTDTPKALYVKCLWIIEYSGAARMGRVARNATGVGAPGLKILLLGRHQRVPFWQGLKVCALGLKILPSHQQMAPNLSPVPGTERARFTTDWLCCDFLWARWLNLVVFQVLCFLNWVFNYNFHFFLVNFVCFWLNEFHSFCFPMYTAKFQLFTVWMEALYRYFVRWFLKGLVESCFAIHSNSFIYFTWEGFESGKCRICYVLFLVAFRVLFFECKSVKLS